MASRTTSTSSGSGSRPPPPPPTCEALLRAVAKQGQEETSMVGSFWAGGAYLAGAAAAALARHARPAERPGVQEWLAARVSQHVSEDYRWVNPIVHGLLLVLEWALGLGVALLSLLGLGYLAAGLYYACLRGAAEPPPELENLTDEQRRLLGLEPALDRSSTSKAAAALASPAAAAAAAGRGPLAGGGAGASPFLGSSSPMASSSSLFSPPTSTLLRDRSSPFSSSGGSGRPPLTSTSTSGGRRAYYGRSRGIAGAALSFGGGADEQMQGYLEVRLCCVCVAVLEGVEQYISGLSGRVGPPVRRWGGKCQ